MNNSKQLAFTIVLVILIAMVSEFSSYIVVTRVLSNRGLYYSPDNAPAFATIEENWHPSFGWPNPDDFRPPARDESGARNNPHFSAEHENCVSAYGESVVFDYRVSDARAWSNELSARLGCRVANFGEPSYGVDQALLRFQANDYDRSRVAIMGLSSAAIPRNVSQFRALLPFAGREADRAGLKPRFRLNAANQLEFLPVPLDPLTEADYQQLVQHPERYLVDDYFQIGGPSQLTRPRFPYMFTLAKGLVRLAERYGRGDTPWYAEFYRSTHPSNALAVTTRLLQTFALESLEHGRSPLILLFPTVADLNAVRSGRPWHYQPLMENLDEIGLHYINLGDDFILHIGAGDFCALFDADCNSHLNETGSAILARSVHEFLTAKHWETL